MRLVGQGHDRPGRLLPALDRFEVLRGYDPPESLVAEVEAFARQAIPPAARDGDTFAEVVEPEAAATPIERLAAFTGRRP